MGNLMIPGILQNFWIDPPGQRMRIPRHPSGFDGILTRSGDPDRLTDSCANVGKSNPRSDP